MAFDSEDLKNLYEILKPQFELVISKVNDVNTNVVRLRRSVKTLYHENDARKDDHHDLALLVERGMSDLKIKIERTNGDVKAGEAAEEAADGVLEKVAKKVEFKVSTIIASAGVLVGLAGFGWGIYTWFVVMPKGG